MRCADVAVAVPHAQPRRGAAGKLSNGKAGVRSVVRANHRGVARISAYASVPSTRIGLADRSVAGRRTAQGGEPGFNRYVQFPAIIFLLGVQIASDYA